jgi:hypothetical protein
MDIVLVLGESGSMKQPKPHGSMDGAGGLKALAKELVSHYALGVDAVRFSVVSFAADATTRVGWSYSAAEIHAGIDQMSADGQTSISDGLEAAHQQLLYTSGRKQATKVMLIVSTSPHGGRKINLLLQKQKKKSFPDGSLALSVRRVSPVRVFSPPTHNQEPLLRHTTVLSNISCPLNKEFLNLTTFAKT